jgi:peptidyl-prolyl cis-trans isomerase SurA
MAAAPVLAFALAGLFADVSAPLDRVAAVVGERPVFLSEVRRRVRPHFYRIDFMGGDEKTREAAKTTAMKETLERIIDERVEAAEADKIHVTADDSEIESAIKAVGAQAKMSTAELMAEAKKQGMTEAEYREEIRRQLLEGKLMQLRVRPRVKITEADARNVYTAWVKEQTGPDAPIDLRILVLQVPNGATPDAKKAKEALAAQLVTQAKSGTDFCSLVTTHSDDPSTKATCGSRGPMTRSLLLADIAKASASLKPGETAGPITFTDPAGSQAYLVIQRAPGAPPAVPAFEKVKQQMTERATLEATERERKRWLQELRKSTFIEVKP